MRLRIFEMLRGTNGGLPSTAIKRKLGIADNNGYFSVVIRGEICAGRIKATEYDVLERDVRYYSLTKKGAEALKTGKVDSDAKRLKLQELGRTPQG
jgi:hypothetical protein